MLKRIILAGAVAALAGLALPSRASAYGAAHVGYTRVGPGGVYHAGRTVGYGPGGVYAGGRAGGVGYGGAYGYRAGYGGGYGYRAGYGAAGGYPYAPGYYGRGAVGGYRYGYVR